MSTQSLAGMELPVKSLSERPDYEDLYTMKLSRNDLWYRIGLELGIAPRTLDAIRVQNAAKPNACKRAMFKEWLNSCPAERCTWANLIQALEKVDPTTAQSVSLTIATEPKQSPETIRPQIHTTQFPLVSDASVSASISKTFTSDSEKSHRPRTEIVSIPHSSAALTESSSTTKKQEKSLTKREISSTAAKVGMERHRESDPTNDVRSVSAEAYFTASDDETVQPFSYQHSGEAIEHSPATDHQICDIIDSDNVGALKRLISRGKVTHQTRLQHNRTPLMHAAQQGSKDSVAFLLKRDDFNSLTLTDEDGAIALFFAVNRDCYEVAKLLIDQHVLRGIGLNQMIKGTPLIIFPASKGFHRICELLLENRADPNIVDKAGQSALIIASSLGHHLVVQVILKFNADITIMSKKTCRTALEEAICCGHTETIKLLAEATSRAKANDLKLFTCKTREEVDHLVRLGAKVDARRGNKTTPIMVHAEGGSLDLVQELLHHNANIDLQDEIGETALIKASACGHSEVVDALLEAGTIVNHRNSTGHTALAVAILNKHNQVVHILLLAGADVTIRNKEGYSIKDVADSTNDQEIIETIKQSRSGLREDGEFVDLLSSYMQKDGKKDTLMEQKAAKKRELMKKMPQSLHPPKDEENTRKKELEKAHERIGILETRVHDLTLQVAVEIPTDEELTHLEREHLEAEFRKIKELKRKAEQYAVEGKQAAQRQSAENFKLREDLSKERHHNELTHKNIIREMEEIVDKCVDLEERNQAKRRVFELEVAKRARQLAAVSGTLQTQSLGIFKFNRDEIKMLIFKHSVKMSHVSVVITGLPFSGKSTLFQKMLQITDMDAKKICNLPGLAVVEAAAIRNPYRLSENLPKWLSTNDKDTGLLTLSTCIAKICAKINQDLSSDAFSEGESDDSAVSQLSEKFKLPLVNEYFERSYRYLSDVCVKLERESSMPCLQHGSLVFMNLWDVGVNKAVSEIMSLIMRRCRNLIMLDVLSLEKDALKLNDRLDLRNQERYHGRYSARKDEEKFSMPAQRSLYYYIACLSPYSDQPNTCLLIGTHKDAFKEDLRKASDISSNVRYLVEDKMTTLGCAKALYPQMLTVDARSEKDAKKVCATVERMITEDDRFERTVPISWIMLRGVLHATKRMFLPKSEVWLYASECGLQSLEELDAFLDLFQSSLSIIYSQDEMLATLHNNVIVDPFRFFQCLNRLYYAELNDSFHSTPKLSQHLDLIKKGILTYTFAQKMWSSDPDTTLKKDKGENPRCNFLLRVLIELNVCTKIDLSILSAESKEPLPSPPIEKFYYVPSLRYSHSQRSIQPESLIIITSNIHQAPCNIFSEFLSFVQQQESTKSLKFVPEEYYDVLHLKWVESQVLEADIEMRMIDCEDLVELSVLCNPYIKLTVHESHLRLLKRKVCSVMKTTCIEFFHKISQIVPSMTYKLAVVSECCPEDDSGKLHLVPFDIIQHSSHLTCLTCRQPVPLLQLSERQSVWITSAYQGSPQHTVSARDTLSRSDLVSVAEDLYTYSPAMTTELAKKLGIQESEMTYLKQFGASDDFPLLVLLEWKKRLGVASRPQLAEALLHCGFTSLAIKLDNTVEDINSLHHLQAVQSSWIRDVSKIVSEHLPYQSWREIGRQLDIVVQDMHHIVQANPQDKTVLEDVIQRWLSGKNENEAMLYLKEVLGAMNMQGICDLLKSVKRSDDSQWIK